MRKLCGTCCGSGSWNSTGRLTGQTGEPSNTNFNGSIARLNAWLENFRRLSSIRLQVRLSLETSALRLDLIEYKSDHAIASRRLELKGAGRGFAEPRRDRAANHHASAM